MLFSSVSQILPVQRFLTTLNQLKTKISNQKLKERQLKTDFRSISENFQVESSKCQIEDGAETVTESYCVFLLYCRFLSLFLAISVLLITLFIFSWFAAVDLIKITSILHKDSTS